jgi:predicted RNase H-like HicB family nuclease
MHTAMKPVRNPANLSPGEDPGLMSIVADMTSLILHVRASARLIEAAIQRDCGGDGNETADVVILDDLTPCYAAASETLSACNAGLDAALQSLLGTLPEAKRPALRRAMFSHKSA